MMSASAPTPASFRSRIFCLSSSSVCAFSMPEPPGMKSTPYGPWTSTSARSMSSSRRFSRYFFEDEPSTMSTFAMPRSASRIITRLPTARRAMARLTVKFVLPTPPLPLVTAMTRAFVENGRRGRAGFCGFGVFAWFAVFGACGEAGGFFAPGCSCSEMGCCSTSFRKRSA